MYYRQQNQMLFPIPGFPPSFPGPGTNINQRVERLERQVDRLERQVDRLSRRLERVERRLGMFGN